MIPCPLVESRRILKNGLPPAWANAGEIEKFVDAFLLGGDQKACEKNLSERRFAGGVAWAPAFFPRFTKLHTQAESARLGPWADKKAGAHRKKLFAPGVASGGDCRAPARPILKLRLRETSRKVSKKVKFLFFGRFCHHESIGVLTLFGKNGRFSKTLGNP